VWFIVSDTSNHYGRVLLAYKCVGDGFIYVINLASLLRRQQKQAAVVCGLQWTRTDTTYINLAAATGSYSR